ncbi:MAG: Por secretion system C-terminal sorting protein, partial [Akkermansiaceae bacterium]|nr:Por secretion system C-terminal sorting protein [Akkermansiaceae bacterium]
DYTYELTATNTETGDSIKAHTTLRSVIGGEATFRYIRFTTLKTRVPTSASTQISEFLFYHGFDQVTPVGVENPGGSTNPNGNEVAAKVIDGSVTSKWLDQNRAPLIFDLGENPPAFDGYAMATPNDAPERDPVQWILEGSNDKTTWSLVDNLTAFDYPTSVNRQTFGQINPLPGPSLIPYFGTGLVGSASSLVAGDALTLTYNVGYAQSASLSDGVTVTPLSGATGRVEFHPTQNTTYTLTAVGKGGYTGTATFQTTIVSPAIREIAYADFNSAGDELTFLGTSSIVNDYPLIPLPGDQKRLRVTDLSQNLLNSVWFRKRQKLVEGFDTSFGLQITRLDGANGADGIAFVIQNAPQGSDLLVSNPEIGAQPQALSIGFDTFANSGQPSGAQVRIGSAGQTLALVDLSKLEGFPLKGPGRLLDPTGQTAPYAVHISYVPGSLSISMEGILIVDSLAVDLGALGALDSAGTAYVGFAARTGSSTEAHDITSWTLTQGAVVPMPELKLLASSINAVSGQVSLTWQSSAAKNYRITASQDLTFWTPLQSGIAGLAGQTTATVTSAPASRMFFRVEEE